MARNRGGKTHVRAERDPLRAISSEGGAVAPWFVSLHHPDGRRIGVMQVALEMEAQQVAEELRPYGLQVYWWNPKVEEALWQALSNRLPAEEARQEYLGLKKPQYLRVGEAAAELGLTEQSIRRLLGGQHPRLRGVKDGPDWRIDLDSVRTYKAAPRRRGRPPGRRS
jgi:hypothetical protein